jgi:hypothetical protein
LVDIHCLKSSANRPERLIGRLPSNLSDTGIEEGMEQGLHRSSMVGSVH